MAKEGAKDKKRIVPEPFIGPSCTGPRGAGACHTLIKLPRLKFQTQIIFNIILKKSSTGNVLRNFQHCAREPSWTEAATT